VKFVAEYKIARDGHFSRRGLDLHMSHKKNKIRQLEREIEELKRQWPAHSISPAMLQQLEDLEAELERIKSQESQGPSPEK